MKILLQRRHEQASALLIVLSLGAVSLMVLAGTMRWTSGTAMLSDRTVRHSIAVSAAEAATEKVLAEIGSDFAKQGAARPLLSCTVVG